MPPNTQRQKTTTATGCCAVITNQPIVPEMNMALAISAAP